jgi:sucrose-6-phosphate hydrolase SacC (GH32 family)
MSGNVDFHPAFAGRHTAPARITDGELRLQIFVDRSTVEVFVNNGEAVISDRIFPTGDDVGLEVFAGDESAKIESLTLHPLKSIWHHNSTEQ